MRFGDQPRRIAHLLGQQCLDLLPIDLARLLLEALQSILVRWVNVIPKPYCKHQFLLQVLEQISINLSPSDRLRWAQTCRRWARIVCASHMLEDFELVVYGPTQMERLESFISNSERHYRRLSITGSKEGALVVECRPFPQFFLCFTPPPFARSGDR